MWESGCPAQSFTVPGAEGKEESTSNSREAEEGNDVEKHGNFPVAQLRKVRAGRE